MDDQRFDSLTKVFARGRSRRDVLKLLAGGTAGTVLLATVANDAGAECHGIACSGDGDCCTGAPYCNGGVCAINNATEARCSGTDTNILG